MLLLAAESMQTSAAIRVRDRHLIRVAVAQEYALQSRTASADLRSDLIVGAAEVIWDYRVAHEKEAFGGIVRAVKKLVDLLKKAPRAIPRIFEALGLSGTEDLSWLEKGKLLGVRLKELITQGGKYLQKLAKQLKTSFPISMFFVDKHRMPGLTDLMNRLAANVPWLSKALGKIHGGAEVVDKYLKRYIPTLSRAAYAAIFAYIWFSVAELSWDIPGLVAGFTGQISLSELLSSMPESALGLLFAQMGLGYGMLPVTLVLRVIWMVANHYLEYIPGKGLRVRWDLLGISDRPDEIVAV